MRLRLRLCCVAILTELLVLVIDAQPEEGCEIRKQGLSYYCNFNGRPIHFDIDFNLCDEPANVLVTIDIPALKMYLREQFESSENVPIPEFGQESYIQIKFVHINDSVNFRLAISAFGLPSFTIIERHVEHTECRGVFDWLNSWSVGSVVAICTGLVLLVVLLGLWLAYSCLRMRHKGIDTVFANTGIWIEDGPEVTTSLKDEDREGEGKGIEDETTPIT